MKKIISATLGVILFGLVVLLTTKTSLAAGSITYDGVTFEEWTSTTDLPQSGNYYLSGDVTYTKYGGEWYVNGLKLLLNGKKITLSGYDGYVTCGGSFDLYDNTTTGEIYSGWVGDGGLIYDEGPVTIHGGRLNGPNCCTFNCSGNASVIDAYIINNGTLDAWNSDVPMTGGVVNGVVVGNSRYGSSTVDVAWLEPLKTELNIAADPEFGGNVNHTAEYTGNFALPKEILEFLKAHPDTTLVYTYMKDELTSVTVTISGKNVVLLDGVDFYGIDKLVALYGAGVSTASGDYVIQPGDTLTSLAAKFGTTIEALLAKNSKITNRDLIYAGDKLNH